MLAKLEKYFEDGLVYKQVHPTLPLTIWNYSEKVQFERLWDDLLLMTRGLVTDQFGNIVARPFKKFFNLEEGMHSPTSEFEVYEKMDGSLGILMNYEGEWILATRGSFTSDQAIRGSKILEKYSTTLLTDKDVYEILGCNPINITYLFEIIYPENQIVVKYGFEELVLLGAIHRYTREEISFDKLEKIADIINCPIVTKYDSNTDFKTLKENIDPNREGYVVKFSNGDRMKIKGKDYIELHKVVTNLSTTLVWEILSLKGDMLDLYKGIPDEFYDKIKLVVSELEGNFKKVKSEITTMYNMLYRRRYDYDRKTYAEWVKTKPKEYSGTLFKMYDGREYDDLIWKIIKPEYRKI